MRRESGFTYVILMFLVAAISLISVRALYNTLTMELRDKEAELLRVGQAYRTAIKNYYQNAPGSNHTYPAELETLLLDQRNTILARPLRKPFRDPITGSTAWGIVRAADGGVMGVYSLSLKTPIKKAGFPPELSNFVNATSYQGWQFVFQPASH